MRGIAAGDKKVSWLARVYDGANEGRKVYLWISRTEPRKRRERDIIAIMTERVKLRDWGQVGLSIVYSLQIYSICPCIFHST